MLEPHRRRILNRQAELFEVLSDRPRWSDIPRDTRRAVTELLARILSQYRLQEAGAQEVEHE